jgi:hypothetical protein
MATLESTASDAPNCCITYKRNWCSLAKAKAKTNETFIVQASLKIVTYDSQNMFIVQATEVWYLTAVFLLVFAQTTNFYRPIRKFAIQLCNKALLAWLYQKLNKLCEIERNVLRERKSEGLSVLVRVRKCEWHSENVRDCPNLRAS